MNDTGLRLVLSAGVLVGALAGGPLLAQDAPEVLQGFGGQGATKSQIGTALDQLAQSGNITPASVRAVLAKEFFDPARAAAAAGNPGEIAKIRTALAKWMAAGTSPPINQVVQSEIERSARQMIAAPAGDPLLLNLVILLADLRSPTCRNVLLELARSPDPAVRYLAAQGLYLLVSADKDPVTLTDTDLNGLAAIAVKESNEPTLDRLYLIFRVSKSAVAADALVRTLAARVEHWQATGNFRSAEADRAAVVAIRGFYPDAPPALKDQVHKTLGRLLVVAVQTYVERDKQLSDSQRLALVLLIMELDKTLQAISPGKNSTPSLSDGIKEGTLKLLLAATQWWGEPGTKGILESPPYSLPAGAGLAGWKLPAASQPASGPTP